MWTLAVAPVLAAQHRAAHVHVVCEHGSQIDLGEATTHVAPHTPDRSVDDGRAPAGESDSDHHHCSLGCTATITVAARPVAVVGVMAAPALAARVPLPVARTVDVLVDAPKTSPPV